MGTDFVSKTRDRVQKTWKASYAKYADGLLPYPDTPVDREVIRVNVLKPNSLAIGETVLLRLTDASAIEMVDGMRVIGGCIDVPASVLKRFADHHRMAAGNIVAKGQLLSTMDVEIEPAISEGITHGYTRVTNSTNLPRAF